MPITSGGRKRSWKKITRRCSSPLRTNCRRNIASSSAARRWRPTPISAQRCGAISARSTPICARPGFAGSFLVVQSTGGLYEAEQAQDQCVRMLESGPAAGVIGTQALCRALKIDNAIAFDMGGTTAKAGVIYHGEALTTGAALIGGYEKALPVQIAMMDIFEVSAGGGSIARVDDGALRLGPQSAGASPGPGLLRPRRHRADRDRRQSDARPARRRALSGRRDEARRRRRRARAERTRSAIRSA